jgi:uncharacterized protein (TIGR02246 family)
MSAVNDRTTSESQLRKLIEDQVASVRAKDVDRAIANYAPDVVSFDVVNTLQKKGSEACRKRAEEWFSSFQGTIGYEVQDLKITCSDDLAFCHSLNRVKATKTDGGLLEMWWRATVCYRKIDGKWLVFHEHNSVPFDAGSGKAQLDLKP